MKPKRKSGKLRKKVVWGWIADEDIQENPFHWRMWAWLRLHKSDFKDWTKGYPVRVTLSWREKAK